MGETGNAERGSRRRRWFWLIPAAIILILLGLVGSAAGSVVCVGAISTIGPRRDLEERRRFFLSGIGGSGAPLHSHGHSH